MTAMESVLQRRISSTYIAEYAECDVSSMIHRSGLHLVFLNPNLSNDSAKCSFVFRCKNNIPFSQCLVRKPLETYFHSDGFTNSMLMFEFTYFSLFVTESKIWWIRSMWDLMIFNLVSISKRKQKQNNCSLPEEITTWWISSI